MEYDSIILKVVKRARWSDFFREDDGFGFSTFQGVFSAGVLYCFTFEKCKHPGLLSWYPLTLGYTLVKG